VAIAYPVLSAAAAVFSLWAWHALGGLMAQVWGLLAALALAGACVVYLACEDGIVAACRAKPAQRYLFGGTTLTVGFLGLSFAIMTLLNQQFFVILTGWTAVTVVVIAVAVGVFGLVQGIQLFVRPRALAGDEETWAALDVGEALARIRARPREAPGRRRPGK
jgi:hypothetical protein